MQFDPTISWGSIFSFLGSLGLFCGFMWRANHAATQRALDYNEKFNNLSERSAIIETNQAFYEREQLADRTRHDREMTEIKDLLEQIRDKLDNKADRGE